VVNEKNMRMYKCDKCGEVIGENEVLKARIGYDRTPEEIDQLMEKYRGNTRQEIIKYSRVQKELDLCKECYDKLKKEYFG